jgi:DinB family.
MSSTAAASNAIATSLIAELEHEGAVTRKVLERIPPEKFDWKPHEKSMTMGRLATHVAEMHGWTKFTVEQPELDFGKNGLQAIRAKNNRRARPAF